MRAGSSQCGVSEWLWAHSYACRLMSSLLRALADRRHIALIAADLKPSTLIRSAVQQAVPRYGVDAPGSLERRIVVRRFARAALALAPPAASGKRVLQVLDLLDVSGR
jgi:hypothetical protein